MAGAGKKTGGRRLRVLLLSRNYPRRAVPALGTYVEAQVRWLRRSADVWVVSPVSLTPSKADLDRAENWRRWLGASARKVRTLREVERGSAPLWFHLPKRPFEATEGLLLAAALWLQRRSWLPRGWTPDLLHGHFVFPDGFAAVVLGRLWRVPVVVTAHGSDLHLLPDRGPGLRAVVRWVLRHADAVVAVSPQLARRARSLGAPGSRVHVVPNGYDGDFRPIPRHEARRRLGLPVEGRLVLYAGNLYPVKGVDLLIRAFARLNGRAGDARLLLVGDGFARPWLEALVPDLSLHDRVTFVGPRPHGEMPLWLAASDVLALASRSEGWPVVVTEALALGTPVVATRVGAVPELLAHPELGITVPPEDEDAFARALALSLERSWDPEKIRRLAPVWSWREVAARLLSIYREVLP